MKKKMLIRLLAVTFLSGCGSAIENQSMEKANEKTFEKVNYNEVNPLAYPGYTRNNGVMDDANTPSDYINPEANLVQERVDTNKLNYMKIANRNQYYHGKDKLTAYNPGLSEKINLLVEDVQGVIGVETIVYDKDIYVGVLTDEKNVEQTLENISVVLSSYEKEYEVNILEGMRKHGAVYRISQQLKTGHYYETDIKELDMSL